MTIRAYYNEIDPFAAAWLRNLITAGHIPAGDVDERSIEDVLPDDLDGYIQAHWFAGLGGWPHALRLAGWPDDRPVWTGSCPCQPFSAAGKGGGVADERHLWPSLYWLVCQCRPPVLIGEQVASPAGLAWFDAVHADMDAAGYAIGAADLCAAGIGAPHIRQRLFFVADADASGLGIKRHLRISRPHVHDADGRIPNGLVADAVLQSGERRAGSVSGTEAALGGARLDHGNFPDRFGHGGQARELADATDGGCKFVQRQPGVPRKEVSDITVSQPCDLREARELGDPSGSGLAVGSIPSVERGTVRRQGAAARPAEPVRNFWADPEWIYCRDGKHRPVESGYVEMVDGLSASLGRRCPGSDETEKIDGAAQERPTKTMSGMPHGHEPQNVQERPGGHVSLHEAGVLRPSLHGKEHGGKDQSSLCEKQPSPVGQGGEGRMREVRSAARTSARSPHRREPTQQYSCKLDDVVQHLSPSLPLAVLRGDDRTAFALRALQQAIVQGRPLRNPSESLEETWASLSEEEKGRIELGFDASRWRLVAPFPLATNVQNRVGKLRAYGNAIVAPLAAEFVTAFLEQQQQA